MEIEGYEVEILNKTTIKIGCTKVKKASIVALLKRMATAKPKPVSKFKVGRKVKAVLDAGDTNQVIGLTGTIVNANSLDSMLIDFPDFKGGHGAQHSQWYVPAKNLQLVHA